MSGLNDTVNADRLQIGFFGRRNAGKSSLMNAVTGQALSVVSSVKGTTTDPVQKAMELLPLGAVLMVDTAGLDDDGELGALRVEKTMEVLRRTDAAVLVVDAETGVKEEDSALTEQLRAMEIPYVTVMNKCDCLQERTPLGENILYVSAETGEGVDALKTRLGIIACRDGTEPGLFDGLVSDGDAVVLVMPIDSAAPKGRLILPQQQALRALLDLNATGVAVQPEQLTDVLHMLKDPPKLVVTDSQAFKTVGEMLPRTIPLTSFSVLLARRKGVLDLSLRGVTAVESLQDGDVVLVSEGCTHHRQCGDIGTVKIPRLLRGHTGKSLTFETSSGRSFPADLSKYAMVAHCGGCMLGDREMRWRMGQAAAQQVPVTNYGVLLAYLTGQFPRAVECLQEIVK